MAQQGGVITSPVPVYQNLPIDSDFYKPSRFEIEDIDLGIETTVTTTVDHNYVIGQLVRLLIPANYGCFQLNQKTGYVIAIPASDQVLLDIDSSINVDSFISASTSNVPQIVAVGDIRSGQINSNGRIQNITFIPGSFINISPQ